MNAERFTFSGSGGQLLPAVVWTPECPKAVIQVTHGMTEHMGRYKDFAAQMCQAGIAVAGFDLRGHGANDRNPQVASFGVGGWDAALADMHLFAGVLAARFPGLPRIMLGFSLGSFLLREYIGKYPEDHISGAVIMGTGQQPGWLMSILMGVVQGQVRKAGFDQTTDLVRQLSFDTYNQKFKPNRTNADWLCSETAALDDYLADPLVRPNISAGLFWELLGSMKRTGSKTAYDCWDKRLPILLLSGQDDAVGDGGKGVQAVLQSMKKAGLTDVSIQLFPGARHDLLHEKAGVEAMEAITNWGNKFI